MKHEIETEYGRFAFWGNECQRCETSTEDTMFCNECGRVDATIPLFRPVRAIDERTSIPMPPDVRAQELRVGCALRWCDAWR